MNARLIAAVGLALFAAGCRTDPSIAYLENRDRILEDRIYELQDQVAKYQRALAACRGEGVVSEGVPATDVGPALGPATGPAAQPVAPRPLDRRGPAAPAPGAVPKDRPTPNVEMPGEAVPPGTVPKRFQVQPNQLPAAKPAPPPERGTSTGAAPSATPTGWTRGAGNTRVTQIALNRQFTSGYNADGQPGDEGIMVSIEPRDAQGNLVTAIAPVSVAVLDPALQGPAARVARWDFNADQIAALVQSTRSTEGIQMAVTWPGAPPVHSQLRLFVRYTTDDGRKLQADLPIEINLAAPSPASESAAPAGPSLLQADRADWRQGRAPRAAPPVVAATEAAAPPEEQDAEEAPPVRVATRPARAPKSESPPPSEPPRKRPRWSPER